MVSLLADTALPASSKNKTDYQASIIGFQRVYIWKGTFSFSHASAVMSISTLSACVIVTEKDIISS